MALGALSLPATTGTGTNLIPRGALLPDAPTADVQPMSPMDSLSIMFSDMRDSLFAIAENTLRANELLETAVLGTPEQRRDADISAEDRDPAPGKEEDEEEGPGFLTRLGNQTKGFFGTLLGKGVLAGLALLATYVFEDEIIKGVGNFMKFFKEDFGPMIKDLYEDVLSWWDKTWKGVTTFFAYVKSVFTAINDYVMQYDINEDGKIDESEFGALKEDLVEKTKTLIGDFFESVMLSLGGMLLSATFVGIASKAAYARLAPLFTGTATTAAAGAVGGPMAGLATALPIAGLILYGFSTTYTNISRALKKTLDDNKGQFDTSDFFANFLGGSEEGGVMNAFKQAFLVGGTFALAGMAIGLPFGPLGILAGGLIGTAVGMAVGAFTGYIGSGVLKEKFQGFADMINESVDFVKNFYNDIVAGFKSLFSGGSFMEGFSARGDADVEGLTKKVEAAENYVKEIEKFQAENPKLAALPANVELLANAKADLEELKKKLDKAPAKAKALNLENINDELEKKIEKRDKLQAKVDKGNLMPGIDSVSQGVPYETQIKNLDSEINQLTIAKKSAESDMSLDEIIETSKPADFSNAQFVMDQTMMEKYKALGMEFEPNEKGGGYVIVDSSNSGNQNAKVDNNYYPDQKAYMTNMGFVSYNSDLVKQGN